MSQSQREETELKAWYTVPELARMAGTTRDDMRRTLRRTGVTIRTEGRTGRVLLSELRRVAPDIWQSILLVQRFRDGDLDRSPAA